MKKIILIFLIYFPLSTLVAQEVLPDKSVIASQRIKNQLIGYDLMPTFIYTKMNKDYVYTLNWINDKIIISPEYDTIFSREKFINEAVVVQYNKDLSVENVLQIRSDMEVFVENLTVSDDDIWIVGKCTGDTLFVGDQPFSIKDSGGDFFINFDENLNYKSHFFIEGSHGSTIEQDGDITYIIGNSFYGSIIFNGNTITSNDESGFLLAVDKGNQILWKKVFDHCSISSLEVMPDQNVLVHGFAHEGLFINGEELSKASDNGFHYFTIFDKKGDRQWFQAGQTITDITFGPNNTLYCSGFYKKDSTIIGDTILYGGNLGLFRTYLAEFDWKNKKLNWASQFKGKYVSPSQMEVENDVLTVFGNCGLGMEFQNYKVDSGNVFIYRRFLDGQTRMFTLSAGFSINGYLLDMNNKEILIGGDYRGEILSGNQQLDGAGIFLALINTDIINSLTEILQPKNDFVVYPNPIQKSDYLKVISDFESEYIIIKMVNNLGQLILENHQGNTVKLPPNLQSGIYYLMIEDDKGSELHKLIVE